MGEVWGRASPEHESCSLFTRIILQIGLNRKQPNLNERLLRYEDDSIKVSERDDFYSIILFYWSEGVEELFITVQLGPQVYIN